MQPDADLHCDAVCSADLLTVVAHGVLRDQRRIAGPHGVIFMGDRRAEQGHDAVAQHLIHRAFVLMNGCHHALQHRVEELARLFGVAVGQQLYRPLEIGKQHGHLLPLAFEGGLGGEDFLGEIGRRVAERRVRAGRHWWDALSPGLREQRGPACATELGLWLIHESALGTRHPEGSAAVVTKFQALGILKATACAAHGCTLRHGRASRWVARGQAPRRAPLTWVYGMLCQYFRWGWVSSEKHATAVEAGMEVD